MVTGKGPVTDLQPYPDTYAHVIASHAGRFPFAHLHPSGTVNGDHGGPRLTVGCACAFGPTCRGQLGP
jgi:hypothetical protein